MAKKIKRPPLQKPSLSGASLSAEVQRLRKVGNFSRALELLKDTSLPEWKEVFLERVDHLLERGRGAEAARRLDEGLVLYPGCPALEARKPQIRALNGDWEAVFQDLPGGPAEEAIRKELIDLRLLANCQALATDHPLRQAAAKLAEAFDNVTSQNGKPVVLPDLSRRNPLAGWRLLIQAIAAFYRREDELCRRSLAAIPADSAAARGGKVLLAALEGKPNPPLAAELSERPIAAPTLERLEQAIESGQTQARLLPLLQQTLRELEGAPSALLKRVRQRLWLKLELNCPNAFKIFGRLGYPCADADFWRELALLTQKRTPLLGAVAWEEFRHQARAANLLEPACESVLLLHIAELVPERKSLNAEMAMVRRVYQNQPAEIRRASPLATGKPPADYLDPERLYHRACALDPIAENFQRWMQWEKSRRFGNPKTAGEAWLAHHPKDVAALKAMVQLTEQSAPVQAQGYLKRALALDKMDPELQKARVRVALAITLKGLAKKKPQPLKPEGLEELQNTSHGRALWAALQCLDGLCRQQPSQARAGFQATEAALGDSVLALHLLDALLPRRAHEIELLAPSAKLKPSALAGLVQLAALERDFSVSIFLDDDFQYAMLTLLPKAAKEPTATLAEAARYANSQELWVLAYAITNHGLQRAEAHWLPVFLQERGRSIPQALTDRFENCLAAAWKLAGQLGNEDLKNDITRLALEWHVDPRSLRIDDTRLKSILESERSLTVYPEDDEDDDEELCQCADCRARREDPEKLMELLEMLLGGRRR